MFRYRGDWAKLSRYGAYSSGNFTAWIVNSDGNANNNNVNNTNGARPALYRASDNYMVKAI